jgi:MSHA biogenesis protein MshP
MKRTSATSRSAAGFAVGIVVALLALLAVLGVALSLVSTTQHTGATLDIQGVRAYHAARGGLEWGMYHVLRSGFAGCGGVTGKTLAFAGNLSDFRATVVCTSSLHEESAPPNVTMYALTATACNDTACPTATSPPPPGYVERQLRVTLAK